MPPTPTEILTSPASAYRGWRLHIRCADCHSYAIVELHRLSDRLQALTVASVIDRLVCRRCGCRELSSAQLRHHMQAVWLIGDERDL